MTPTLALEAAMLHPDYDRFIAQVRQAVPVGLVDQLDAAATQATQVATAAARFTGGCDTAAATAAELPGWLRLGLLDALTRWADGKATTCRHSPDPDRPEPVLTAAWKPGLVTCVRCAHLWSLGRTANLTCDCCGAICLPDQMNPGMTQFGALIFQYGTCDDCRPPVASGEPQPVRKPRGSRGRNRGRGRS
ncbi:hypothetical protein AB0A73_13150 [Glycomyces sp. NPDC047369]